MHCEVMNEDLVLQKSDGKTAMFENMTFINSQLPFSEYPADESGYTPNVDMIVGGDLAWKNILCSKSLTWQGNRKVAFHKLGTLWLRTNNESHCHLDVYTLNNSQRLTPKSAVCSKVRLAPSDRHDDVVKSENNILNRSTDNNKVAMSIEDEKVLKNFKETMKLVKVDNDKTIWSFLCHGHMTLIICRTILNRLKMLYSAFSIDSEINLMFDLNTARRLMLQYKKDT